MQILSLCAVLYAPLGSMDLRKAFISGNGRRFERFFWKTLDEASIVVRDLGKKYHNVSQGILMVNMAGFNLAQHVCLQCKQLNIEYMLAVV